MKSSKQGGIRSTLFIFAMIFFENLGFVANMISMVLFLVVIIKFDLSGSATTTPNYLGTTFLVTIIGGFVSDIYMTCLNTTLLFGFLELLGYALLVVQSYYAKLQQEFAIEMRARSNLARTLHGLFSAHDIQEGAKLFGCCPVKLPLVPPQHVFGIVQSCSMLLPAFKKSIGILSLTDSP